MHATALWPTVGLRPMECPVLTLYDNPFSPFARKVRMALRFKGVQEDLE